MGGNIWRIGAAALCLLLGAAPAAAVDGTVAAGWNVGLGLDVAATFDHFTRDLPLSARLGLGYHDAEPGDPYAARSIFINDNTNGDPEKGGEVWLLRFDLLFPAFKLGGQQLHALVGPRHARFTANFNYVGGNENFDVSSNPWGLGVGLETNLVMGESTAFVMQAGFDWYGKAKLAGHDTAYLPAGDDVNPRNDYDWDDADAAIDQPRWEVVFGMGVRFGL